MDNKSKTKNEESFKVTRETNIAELVFKYPQVADVLLAFGLHCVGCFASQFDTIGEGAQIHGMPDEEVDEMIEEVNSVIENPNVTD